MKTETPSVKIVAITADEAGQRIDNFLRTQLKGVPKSMIYRILRKGEVRVNKPSGTAVHGGSGLSFGVIEGLRALRPEARFLELVHRLDRDTSGVLLVAKKRSALRSLHEQLREKGMQKDYLALVRGQWQSHVKSVCHPGAL